MLTCLRREFSMLGSSFYILFHVVFIVVLVPSYFCVLTDSYCVRHMQMLALERLTTQKKLDQLKHDMKEYRIRHQMWNKGQ